MPIEERKNLLSPWNVLKDFYGGQAVTALFDLPFVLLYLLLIAYLGGKLVFVPIIMLIVFVSAISFISRNVQEILENRRTNEFNDILLYVDGNLIGYLALFVFKLNIAEISGFIHPRHREHGFFKKLIFEAYAELKSRNINNAVLITRQPCAQIQDFINRVNATKKISEFEMTATQAAIEKELPEVTFKLATKDDIPAMAQMGSVSFNSPLLEVMQRFIDNSKDKNRKAC